MVVFPPADDISVRENEAPLDSAVKHMQTSAYAETF